jgi:endonuclease-3
MRMAESMERIRSRFEEIMIRFQAAMPLPPLGLIYKTPFQLLVSMILSAKNTDTMVNRVMGPIYEKDFTPQTVIKLGPDGFLSLIRKIGLAPTKARNIHKTSQILLERFEGEVPARREDLESLAGVGRKTASVVLGELQGEPILAVDTHVFRVTARLGLHHEPTPEKAEKSLLRIIDPKYQHGQHRYFIIHGRRICKARGPLCDQCLLSDLCPSYESLRPRPHEIPPGRPRRTNTQPAVR